MAVVDIPETSSCGVGTLNVILRVVICEGGHLGQAVVPLKSNNFADTFRHSHPPGPPSPALSTRPLLTDLRPSSPTPRAACYPP